MAHFWKKAFMAIMILVLGSLLCACEKYDVSSNKREVNDTEETYYVDKETAEQWEKGYDLPVDSREKEEAENDCEEIMQLISDIYDNADKEEAINGVLNEEAIHEMRDRIKKKGYSVKTTEAYSNLENYKSVDHFLKECQKGKSGSVEVYEIHCDGGIGRDKFFYDGKDMYRLYSNAVWNAIDGLKISYISYTRIKEWRYTNKGWFCYKMCVPEQPEVTEIVDGSCLLRIKPLTEEQREMSIKCVQGIGYQGNNLLCSNWDTAHMEKLDYNGIYEYLYAMKYQKIFKSEDYPDGVPKEEFENLLMQYLPVTKEQIQKHAVFDEEDQAWHGCLNYAPSSFGNSLPEVTGIEENDDGTVTLMVDAVCDTVLCDDAVITHELTVRFADDGSFRYLGNKILNNGIKDIPQYQYRTVNKGECSVSAE